MIQLTRNGDRICARLGFHNIDYPMGYGSTLAEALRDLANMLDKLELKVWVPKPAKPYREDGVLKVACPECGAIKESDFEQVIAFVCDSCGLGIDVENDSVG
jgi:hypothetical protein